MLLAIHKTDWHKLTDAQRRDGKLEGEFLTLSASEGPGTWLKRQLAKVLPKRFQGCSGCAKRADWMDKVWNKISMKWFIVLLLSCLTSFAQLKQTGWTTTTNAADARTALGITGGSQTPWASDIDAAGYSLTNANLISASQASAGQFVSGLTVWADDNITSAGGVSFLDLSATATFGLNNGEPAGVGADINLVSANGGVVVGPNLGIGVSPAYPLDIYSADTTQALLVNITQNNASADPSFGFSGIYFNNEDGFNGQFLSLNAAYPPTGVYQPDQIAFNSLKAGGMAFVCRTDLGGSALGPIVFAMEYDTEIARFTPAGQLLVGSETDDGTGALIQSAGDISAYTSYWAQGIQGVDGTMLDGSVVKGGIITHIGP